MKYKASDFIFEEDFIISAECEDCGWRTDNEDDFDYDCPECGGYLTNETSHEDCNCSICNCHIDMWEDVCRHSKEHEIMICKDCYKEIESEE